MITDPAYVLPTYPLLVQAREELARRFADWCRDGASEVAAFSEIEAVVRALTSACGNSRRLP